jgi:hypothetical protein
MRSAAYTDRGSPKGIISIVPIWVAWPMTLAFLAVEQALRWAPVPRVPTPKRKQPGEL